MHIYRLTWTKFAHDISGEGSSIYGGRWNSPGVLCLYTAESRALSALEYAVNTPIDNIPPHLSMVTMNIPDEGHKIFALKQLPPDWQHKSSFEATRHFGADFLEGAKHLIIRMPSVVIPQEYNYIINPLHPDMKKVKIIDVSDFSFDERLKK